MSEKSEMSGAKCNKNGWVKKKLGEVCNSELGKTLNKSKDTGELFPYLCAVNILWDKIDLENLKETKFKSSEIDRYTVKKGDLLICEGGDIGRAAIWNKDETILYQNALHRVRCNDEMNPRFCLLYLYYLKKEGVLDNTYGKGVTIKHLVKSSLLAIPIVVPTLPEQQYIVSELDSLNGIIEKQKEQLKQLDELAQSIFYDMFGDPVTNEKGWKVKKIGEIGTLGRGVSKHRPRNAPELLGGSMPLIQTGDVANSGMYIKNFTATYSDIGVAQSKVWEKDTLCITIAATIGKCAITTFKVCFPDSVVGFVCSKASVNILYMYFIFCSLQKILEEEAPAVAQKNINLKVLNHLTIPVPPLALQQAFASRIEAIEHQKELIKQSLAETENLFNSRMDYYFG